MTRAAIGIMQGRLSPPEEDRFQSFPRTGWRQEFARAREAGLDYIEWIFDAYGAEVNPIVTVEGIRKLNALKNEYGIKTPAICADWLMDFPLVRCTEEERILREKQLHEILGWAQKIGASRVVLPFVDASSMKNGAEKDAVIGVLNRALPIARETGVEMHLEADFGPAEFADFLARLPDERIKVNYDSGNSSGLGFVASEEFAAYGHRIGSIHIKDRLRKPDGSVETRPLGEGSADFDDVFAGVRTITYRGGFTLQVARGENGDEVRWIMRQAEFVEHYLMSA